MYKDVGDKMIFQASGVPVLTSDLMNRRVGIGTENPTHSLHVEGEVASRGSISLSDARCKTNIDHIQDPMAKLMQLRGVSFNWEKNALTGANPPEEKRYGYLAQEVATVLPELVSTDDQGRQSISYDSLIPILSEGLKAQESKLASLEKEVATKQEHIVALEQRLARLESLLF